MIYLRDINTIDISEIDNWKISISKWRLNEANTQMNIYRNWCTASERRTLTSRVPRERKSPKSASTKNAQMLSDAQTRAANPAEKMSTLDVWSAVPSKKSPEWSTKGRKGSDISLPKSWDSRKSSSTVSEKPENSL